MHKSHGHDVLDENGHPHSLLSLWENRRVLVVFMRHLGCRFCYQQAAEVKDNAHLFESRGIGVMVFSIGTPQDLKLWKEEVGYTGEAYVDSSPTNPTTYTIFSLLRVGSMNEITRNPWVMQLGERALEQGFRDNKVFAKNVDMLQTGGVFLLGPGDVCHYVFRSEYPGHHPSLKEVLKAAVGPSDMVTAKTVLTRFAVLASGFSGVEACFVAALAIAPAVFGNILGSMVCGLLYLSFAGATLLAPNIVGRQGPHRTLLAGLLTFCLYIAACFIAKMYPELLSFSLIPIAAICSGIGGAVLWTAEGAILTRSAVQYTRANLAVQENLWILARLSRLRQNLLHNANPTYRLPDHPTNQNGKKINPGLDVLAGTFNTVFQLSLPVGFLLTSILMTSFSAEVAYAVLTVVSLLAWGVACSVPEPPVVKRDYRGRPSFSGNDPGKGAPARTRKRASSAGELMMKVKRELDRKSAAIPGSQGAFTTLSLLRDDKRVAMLVPTNFNMGLMAAFATYYINARVVGPEYGVSAIGWFVAAQGSAAALCAPFFGWLASSAGRRLVMFTGAVCWGIESLSFLTIPAELILTRWVLVALYIAHGAGFSVWQGTATAVHAELFSGADSRLVDAAFANMKLWSGLGSAFGFLVFPVIPDTVIFLLCFATTAVGYTLYHSMAKGVEAEQEEEQEVEGDVEEGELLLRRAKTLYVLRPTQFDVGLSEPPPPAFTGPLLPLPTPGEVSLEELRWSGNSECGAGDSNHCNVQLT